MLQINTKQNATYKDVFNLIEEQSIKAKMLFIEAMYFEQYSEKTEEDSFFGIQSIDIEQIFLKLNHIIDLDSIILLWVTKEMLLLQLNTWIKKTNLKKVDFIFWKGRTRRTMKHVKDDCYLVFLAHKDNTNIENCTLNTIWEEMIDSNQSLYEKPLILQKNIIKVFSERDDIIVSISVRGSNIFKACLDLNRSLIGCSLQ